MWVVDAKVRCGGAFAPTTALASQKGLTSIQTFLGRPWKHHARVVFHGFAPLNASSMWMVGYRGTSPKARCRRPTRISTYSTYGEYKKNVDMHGTNIPHLVDWNPCDCPSQTDSKTVLNPCDCPSKTDSKTVLNPSAE
jgi:hypothetical protein